MGSKNSQAPQRCFRAPWPWGAGLVLLLALAACEENGRPAEKRVADASPDAGREVILRIGCGVCHVIPGIPGANGTVGPSLEQFGRRNLIGGVVPNRPELLAQWVRDAPSLIEDTGMPDLPISEQEAQDVAGYLYTLR